MQKNVYAHKNTHTSVASSYALEGIGFEFQQEKEIFCSPKPIRQALGPTKSPIQWVPGFSPSGKVAGA